MSYWAGPFVFTAFINRYPDSNQQYNNSPAFLGQRAEVAYKIKTFNTKVICIRPYEQNMNAMMNIYTNIQMKIEMNIHMKVDLNIHIIVLMRFNMNFCEFFRNF